MLPNKNNNLCSEVTIFVEFSGFNIHTNTCNMICGKIYYSQTIYYEPHIATIM